jgi:FkbM family methyltransferase
MNHIANAKKGLWKAMARRMNLHYRMECGLDLRVANYSDWLTLCEIFVQQEYAALVAPVHEACQRAERAVVLDLGANCGFFTAYLCDQLHRIGTPLQVRFVMVEAAPRLAAELSRTMPERHNGYEFEVRQGLAGLRDGAATFEVDYKDNGSHVRGQGGLSSTTVGAVECRYLDLETLVADEDTIACIKIDIEGSEFDLIREYPSLLCRAHTLAIEFHAHSGDAGLALERLRSLGFQNEVACKVTPQTRTYVLTRESVAQGR